MNRSDFLKAMVALVAVPFLPKVEAEAKPEQWNNTQAHKNSYQITCDPIEFTHNGKSYYYFKGMSDRIERFEMEQELLMFKTFRL